MFAPFCPVFLAILLVMSRLDPYSLPNDEELIHFGSTPSAQHVHDRTPSALPDLITADFHVPSNKPTHQWTASQFEVSRKIGDGVFSSVFEAVSSDCPNKKVAVKVENIKKMKYSFLPTEAITLRTIQGSHIPKIISFGHVNKDRSYLVMQLLGPSLDKLLKARIEQRFTLGTALRLTKQATQALEEMHRSGFLHRDVKPANFAIGLPPLSHRILFVIDFGMVRRYRNLVTGQHRHERERARFRGTPNYAPLVMHCGKDSGRKDDLWSVFYMCIQFITGTLPWRDIVGDLERARSKDTISAADLTAKCPTELIQVYEHLNSLKFADEPNYERIYAVLDSIMAQRGYLENEPFDWEYEVS